MEWLVLTVTEPMELLVRSQSAIHLENLKLRSRACFRGMSLKIAIIGGILPVMAYLVHLV